MSTSLPLLPFLDQHVCFFLFIKLLSFEVFASRSLNNDVTSACVSHWISTVSTLSFSIITCVTDEWLQTDSNPFIYAVFLFVINMQ